MRARLYYYLPIAFLVSTSMMYLSYFVKNVLFVELGIYALLLVVYIRLPKIKIKNDSHRLLYGIMVVFGLLYLLRAIVDIVFLDVQQILFTSNYTVFFYVINAMILPLFLVPRAKFQGEFTWVFLFTAIMLVISLFISFSNFIQGNVQQTSDLRTGANESVGVIGYGHLGLTAIIMGVVSFLKREKNKLFKYVSFFLFPLGIVSVFLSGTRGAMIGVVAVFALYFLSIRKFKNSILFILLIVFFIIFSESIINFADSYGAAGSVSRIYRLIYEEGDQSSGRTSIWLYALNQLSESPILGVSCFFSFPDPSVLYIHNSFIEVFYAIGIFGLIAFVIMNYVAIKTCIRIFKTNNVDMKCFAFLYLQYFVFTLFSDTILRLNLFWFFLSVVLCIHFNGLVDNKKKVPKRIESINTENPQAVSAPVQPQLLDTQAL